jgi:cystine transport system ATP-binding protein
VIRDLAVEGWTLVIVTHEIQFARQVSDQVLFTDHGVILEKGPPADVIGNRRKSARASSWTASSTRSSFSARVWD